MAKEECALVGAQLQPSLSEAFKYILYIGNICSLQLNAEHLETSKGVQGIVDTGQG